MFSTGHAPRRGRLLLGVAVVWGRFVRGGTARPRVVAAALLLGVVGLVAVLVLTTHTGQILLVRAGLTRPFAARLAVHLDVALAERFLAMGLLRADLKVRRLAEERGIVREYSFRSPAHLTPTLCNLWVTRTAAAAGADVLGAEEVHARGGEVVIALGFGRHLTHRIRVRPAPPPPERPVARIALVIDDLGHNMNDTVDGILGLGVPLTLAVLPNLSHSHDAFRAAAAAQLPTLLHLPMEPEGDENAGRNPIAVGMDEAAIDALLDKYQRKYPGFTGINNHMGSRATADAPTMRALAAVLERRGLFFLDSVTTPRSVAHGAARARGVWSLRNDLFLDTETEAMETVAARLEQLAAVARKRGLAVGIAHPRPYTLAALQALLPRLQAEGFRFVTLEELRGAPKPAAS